MKRFGFKKKLCCGVGGKLSETQEFVTKEVDSGQISTVKEERKVTFPVLVLRPERMAMTL